MTRRKNIRAILENPQQRREMMIESLITIQAREGIRTTREQAKAAYEAIQAERNPDFLVEDTSSNEVRRRRVDGK